MTVIAWDGKTLAADKRAICSGVHFTTTKLRLIQRQGHLPEALAWSGDQDAGELMAQWYADGADPVKWPECQKHDDRWCRLIVADQYGVSFYERQTMAVRVQDTFCAWGSGRDFALAAMHLGHPAREAVLIASLFEVGCGNGIDVLELG